MGGTGVVCKDSKRMYSCTLVHEKVEYVEPMRTPLYNARLRRKVLVLLYDSKEKGWVDEGRVAALGVGVCSCFGGMLLGGCRWGEDRF